MTNREGEDFEIFSLPVYVPFRDPEALGRAVQNSWAMIPAQVSTPSTPLSRVMW